MRTGKNFAIVKPRREGFAQRSADLPRHVIAISIGDFTPEVRAPLRRLRVAASQWRIVGVGLFGLFEAAVYWSFSFFLSTLTRQTVLPISSAISSEPSLAKATPTGRP